MKEEAIFIEAVKYIFIFNSYDSSVGSYYYYNDLSFIEEEHEAKGIKVHKCLRVIDLINKRGKIKLNEALLSNLQHV